MTQIDSCFLIRPNWDSPVTGSRRFTTTIQTAKTGSEMRAGLRTMPVRGIKYTAIGMTAKEGNYIRKKLYFFMHKVLGIPVWHDGTELSSAVEASEMILPVDEHAYREFEEGGRLVLLDPDDPEIFEICDIEALLDDPPRIQITSGLESGWPERTEVFTLLPMRITASETINLQTDRVGDITIDAEETNETYASMTTTTTTSSTTTTTTA
jgi:hypothetical protein